MIWWIVGGTVAVAVVLLAVVAGGTFRRLRGLQLASQRAQQGQPEVDALLVRVGAMQESISALQDRIETTRSRVEVVKEKRDDQPNPGQIAAKRTLSGVLDRRGGR